MPGTSYGFYFNTDEDIDAGGTYNVTGFWLRETAGAPAVVKFYDAQSATGDPFLAVNLIANESVGDNLDPPLRFKTGIYVDIVSGAVEGGVRVQ